MYRRKVEVFAKVDHMPDAVSRTGKGRGNKLKATTIAAMVDAMAQLETDYAGRHIEVIRTVWTRYPGARKYHGASTERIRWMQNPHEPIRRERDQPKQLEVEGGATRRILDHARAHREESRQESAERRAEEIACRTR